MGAGCLYKCGYCCMLLSIWAVIQLTVMGVFYNFEATPMIGDVHAHEYEDYDDFITKTTKNYHVVAMNCWIAAAIYALFIAISFLCIVQGNKALRKQALELEDDDIVCGTLDEKVKKRKL